MIATLLFVLFVGLMLAGVPIGVALGIGGMVAIAAANADAPWWGLLAAPQNMHASIAKYPLLALPMFVLVGSIFDRSGVAQRMVTFAEACVGRAPGTLPMVAILVAMVLGGISGSGPANAAAVGGVMIAAMAQAGYPAAFSASIVGAAAATDILIPPSIAFIVYSVNGAGRVGAGAVRGRHGARHPGRPRADRSGGADLAPARLRRSASAACRGRRSGARSATPPGGSRRRC